jgi:hypothetical protein
LTKETFEMSYTANDLASVIPQLPATDHDFANSLVSQAKSRGLSQRQLFFVDKLVKKARGEDKVVIGSVAATIAFFDRAKEHLKNPKVIITVDGEPVKLSMAGTRSSQPGTITVAEAGGYGGYWYGRISRDGSYKPTADAARLPGLPEALKRFAEDPAKVAAEHGKLTGHCSFCNRALDDKRSTEVGYGPVCAKRYGLPWG